MTAKAKTGAESPPAPSSSALAAKLREATVGYAQRRTFTDGKHDYYSIRYEVLESVIAALDAQATDKAAAVEKVIELCLGDIKANRNPSYDGGWVDALNWVIGKNPDADKLYGPGPLAILTDSEPKEEERA